MAKEKPESEILLDSIEKKTRRLRKLPTDIVNASKIFDLVSEDIEKLSTHGYSYRNSLSYINSLFSDRFEKTSLATMWSRYRSKQNA
jgi:DNA repair exonuclease SbcCD ATPase subunit